MFVSSWSMPVLQTGVPGIRGQKDDRQNTGGHTVDMADMDGDWSEAHCGNILLTYGEHIVHQGGGAWSVKLSDIRKLSRKI